MKKYLLYLLLFVASCLNVTFAQSRQSVDLDFVYCQQGCKEDHLFVNATGPDNYSVFPYASLRLKFNQELSDSDRELFINEFRLIDGAGKPIQHLHEKVKNLPVLGRHGSFNWLNNRYELIYTAASLSPAKNYKIQMPFGWFNNQNIRDFWTSPFNGDGIRVYEVICHDEECFNKLSEDDTKDREKVADKSYSDVTFTDALASKEYSNAEMKIRGFSSTWFDKKNFTVKFDSDELFEEFQDSSGVYQGPRKKLVFVAQNAFETANLSTNKLMYDVARKLEKRILGAELAADSYFAALVLNGRFWGVYNVTEHISTGKGGWSTMKDRKEVFGFNAKGKGMLHKASFDGEHLGGNYKFEPKTDHEFVFGTRGNGSQGYDLTLPYKPFVLADDFFNTVELDFKVSVKKPKMKLKPDLDIFSQPKMFRSFSYQPSSHLKDYNNNIARYYSDSIPTKTTSDLLEYYKNMNRNNANMNRNSAENFQISSLAPTLFLLIGDGNGQLIIDEDNNSANMMVMFSNPVNSGEKITAEFNTTYDIANYYKNVAMDGVIDYQEVNNWIEIDSSLISMFVIKLTGSWDHGLQNRYMFSKEKDLEAFAHVNKAPNNHRYLDILWDGDLVFDSTRDCVADFLIDYCTRSTPDHWKTIVLSQEGRQRYINLFDIEKEMGGVLTPEYFEEQISNHQQILGNAINFEEIRWNRQIDYQALLEYIRNRFSNPQIIQEEFLSLQNKNYLPPRSPQPPQPPEPPQPEMPGILLQAGRDDLVVAVDSSVYDFSSSHPDGFTQVSFFPMLNGIGPDDLDFQWFANGYTPLKVTVYSGNGQNHTLYLRGIRVIHWDVTLPMNTGANYYNYTDSRFRLEYHQSDNSHLLNKRYTTLPSNPLLIMAQGWHRRDFNEEILFSIDVEIP